MNFQIFMKIIRILVLAIIFPVLLSVSVHKFYVSVTEVEFVKDKNSVQIISRIFIDDLENALRKRYDQHLTFSTTNESKEVQEYLSRYLNEKISIKINGKKADFKFLGREYDNDIVFCYLEINDINGIKSFQISNKVLFDTFDDQQNIVKLKMNNENRSFILIDQDNIAQLKF